MSLVGRSFKILIALIVLGGIILALEWKLSAKESRSEQKYRSIPVTRADIHVRVLSTGNVQPENRLEIKPPVSGRVDTVQIDEGTLVHQGDLLATMSSTERAAMLDAARAQGAAEVRRWEEYYKATPIIAPIDGMLILRNIEPGQTVTTQDAILVLSDRLIVQAQVDETDISRIKVDQRAFISLDAYSDQEIPAKVSKIAYEAKTVNNVTTYLVDVLPDSVPDYMRSGMTANISFAVTERLGVLSLPAYAISKQNGQNTVLQGDPKESASRKSTPIEVGESDGERTEIISGLIENAAVLAPELGEKRTAESNPFAMRPPGAGRR